MNKSVSCLFLCEQICSFPTYFILGLYKDFAFNPEATKHCPARVSVLTQHPHGPGSFLLASTALQKTELCFHPPRHCESSDGKKVWCDAARTQPPKEGGKEMLWVEGGDTTSTPLIPRAGTPMGDLLSAASFNPNAKMGGLQQPWEQAPIPGSSVAISAHSALFCSSLPRHR